MENKNPIPNIDIDDLIDNVKLLSEGLSTLVEGFLRWEFRDEVLKETIQDLRKNLECLKSEINKF